MDSKNTTKDDVKLALAVLQEKIAFLPVKALQSFITTKEIKAINSKQNTADNSRETSEARENPV